MARGRTQKSIVSFNAGELSPFLDARVDIDKYSNGCRQLQNATILSYGAAVRRPGLEYIAPVRYSNRKARLIPFQFSTTTTFTLEFGYLYVRFYSNGAPVLSGGVPYTINSLYDEVDLFQLQVAQINDVMYITHPKYEPHKLSRVTDTNWVLEPLVYKQPPMLDENITDFTLTPSATTGNITLDASSPFFIAQQVGGYWQIAHLRGASEVEQGIYGDGTGTALKVLGEWNIRTYGTWEATIDVERSRDGGTTWERIRRFTGKEDRNVDISGEEESQVELRTVITNWAPESPVSQTPPRVVIEAVDAYIYGLVKITGFNSPSQVTATVIRELESTDPTKTWSEGSWSTLRGFPRAVTVFEQRLVFAGSTFQPQTVWGSVTNDYQNFTYGSTDTDAFAYTLGAQQRDAIEWIVTQKALLIGTSGGEWSMQAGAADQPLTPSNVLVRRQSNYGSGNVAAHLVNDVVLFIQRQKTKVRELTYSFEKDGYVAPDLTLLAEHITGTGIVQTAYQQQTQSIFWCVTADGQLIGMSYERDQSVVGWHRHVTDGFFESVATIYGDSSDEVWVTVRRTIQGVTQRYVERFNPVEWIDKSDAFYVDSGLSYDGAPVSAVSGLNHLEGKTVSILADGGVVVDQVVSGGIVTLDKAASKIHVGLPYETIIQPMRLDVDPMAGVSQGNVKQVRELVVRLYRSLGMTIGNGKEEWAVTFRKTWDLMDQSPPLFTGDKEFLFEGDFDLDTPVIIKQTQPLPLSVLLIVVKYEITGN